MNLKGIANWILSGVVWAFGTALLAIQVVPGMNWKQAATVAGGTFITALTQHLRDHPLTPPTS